MRTGDGLFWPVPVLNLTDETGVEAGARLALRDPNVEGNPVLAIMDVEAVEQVSDDQVKGMAQDIFRTLDENHPGVATFTSLGNTLLSGPIEVLNFSYFQADFPDTFRTAVEIRNEITEHGWNKVVAFQTRNPMHRAHEELCRMAMDDLGADGILIHMLLGKLKPGDIPADVRDAAIRKMVEIYFPPNTVMITGYGFDMLYAGPREAVLHAVFRQNSGCSHLIVGRDHAGVGDYYGGFDAQAIFDEQSAKGRPGTGDLQGRPHRLQQEAEPGRDDEGRARPQQGGLRPAQRHGGARAAGSRRGAAAGVLPSRGRQNPVGPLPVPRQLARPPCRLLPQRTRSPVGAFASTFSPFRH